MQYVLLKKFVFLSFLQKIDQFIELAEKKIIKVIGSVGYNLSNFLRGYTSKNERTRFIAQNSVWKGMR